MKLSVERWFKHFAIKGRAVDRNYIDYVKSLPCLVCGNSPCDPEHVFRRSHGQNDYLTVPLCRKDHEIRGSMGVDTWEETYRIDIKDALIATMATWMIKKLNGEEFEIY